MQRAPQGSVTNKCGCILFPSQSQFVKFHVILKERFRCRAEPASDPPTELKLNPACKTSIRHRHPPVKDIHWVPLLPPSKKTSDILVRDRNSHTLGGMLEILGVFQAFSHPPPEAQRTLSAKVLSLPLSGNCRQIDCCMCPTTSLMTFGKCTKALQKCLLSKPLHI